MIRSGRYRWKNSSSGSIKGFKDVLTVTMVRCDGEKKASRKKKKGKARSKQFGKVEIPQEAFIGVLKINKET